LNIFSTRKEFFGIRGIDRDEVVIGNCKGSWQGFQTPWIRKQRKCVHKATLHSKWIF
jgi:hypothetical protein